jgi:hypothetical protein
MRWLVKQAPQPALSLKTKKAQLPVDTDYASKHLPKYKPKNIFPKVQFK